MVDARCQRDEACTTGDLVRRRVRRQLSITELAESIAAPAERRSLVGQPTGVLPSGNERDERFALLDGDCPGPEGLRAVTELAFAVRSPTECLSCLRQRTGVCAARNDLR